MIDEDLLYAIEKLIRLQKRLGLADSIQEEIDELEGAICDIRRMKQRLRIALATYEYIYDV